MLSSAPPQDRRRTLESYLQVMSKDFVAKSEEVVRNGFIEHSLEDIKTDMVTAAHLTSLYVNSMQNPTQLDEASFNSAHQNIAQAAARLSILFEKTITEKAEIFKNQDKAGFCNEEYQKIGVYNKRIEYLLEALESIANLDLFLLFEKVRKIPATILDLNRKMEEYKKCGRDLTKLYLDIQPLRLKMASLPHDGKLGTWSIPFKPTYRMGHIVGHPEKDEFIAYDDYKISYGGPAFYFYEGTFRYKESSSYFAGTEGVFERCSYRNIREGRRRIECVGNLLIAEANKKIKKWPNIYENWTKLATLCEFVYEEHLLKSGQDCRALNDLKDCSDDVFDRLCSVALQYGRFDFIEKHLKRFNLSYHRFSKKKYVDPQTGKTPLHFAVELYDVDNSYQPHVASQELTKNRIISFLLHHDANFMQIDAQGKSAYDIANQMGKAKVLDLFKSRLAWQYSRALLAGELDEAESCLKLGVEINGERGYVTEPILHCLARETARLSSVRFLLERGVSLFAKNYGGKTASDVAIETGNQECINAINAEFRRRLFKPYSLLADYLYELSPKRKVLCSVATVAMAYFLKRRFAA